MVLDCKGWCEKITFQREKRWRAEMILEPLGKLCSKFSSLGVHCTVKSFIILIKIMVALLWKATWRLSGRLLGGGGLAKVASSSKLSSWRTCTYNDEEEKDWMVLMGLIRRNPKKTPFLLGICCSSWYGLFEPVLHNACCMFCMFSTIHIQCILA